MGTITPWNCLKASKSSVNDSEITIKRRKRYEKPKKNWRREKLSGPEDKNSLQTAIEIHWAIEDKLSFGRTTSRIKF